MIPEIVFHNNTSDYVYPVERNRLVFRLRVSRNKVSECNLVYWNRTTPLEQHEKEMELIVSDGICDYYECMVTYSKIARYQKYIFKIKDFEGKTYFYGTTGVYESCPDDGFFEFLYANANDCINVPEWSKGCVYYQIFPERYANGNVSNDPEDCNIWGTKPTRENFMGGDLAGIIQKVDYLKELGVECLYLNPIFYADFNHKYATTDYYKIDPIFGTDSDFRKLVDTCHNSGIRILLDGVFNHVGIHFSQFEDVIKNGTKSKYVDWFLINTYPIEISHSNYECVGAYKYMPKLNTANSEVRTFIIDVMDYWIREYGIDGWRLDVADEVDGTVWNMARLILKEKYPNILLLGETWGNGGNLLDGHKMDCIMNYCFRDAIRDYIGKGNISANAFANRIGHMQGLTRTVTCASQYNLIDSHDTERFLFYCDGDKDKLKLALAFQMTFVGSPAIYYGDEVGMNGGNDPDCRGCMLWGSEGDLELLDYYKRFIALHKREKALQKGNYRLICVDDKEDVIVFSREYENDKVLVLISRSNTEIDMNRYINEDKSEYEELMRASLNHGSVIVKKQRR